MFCRFCGCEIEEGALFCTGCGKSLEWTAAYEAVTAEDTVKAKLIDTFSTKRFSAATILFTIATALSFLATLIAGNITVPIIEIFAIIAFWQLKNAAQSKSPIRTFVGPFKTLRILTVIQRVVLWVIVGVFSVVGLLMVLFGTSFDNEIAASFIEGFGQGLSDFSVSGFEEIIGYTAENIFLFMIILGAIFVIIAAIVAVFAATMYGSLVKCAKQYENTAATGVNVVTRQKAARGWLIVMVIFAIISATVTVTSLIDVTSILALAGEVCNIIFLFLMIGVLKEDNLQ